MLFFCGPSGVKNRFVDVSHQAIATHHFPISVGVRSQAMKLRFLTQDIEGQFIKPQQDLDQIINNFERRFGRSLPKPILHHAHIGETVSMIYSPFYVKDKLYDAILNKPISTLPEDFNMEDFLVDRPQWHIRFVSTLCPHCGWNLQGQRDALVLTCKNCDSAWYPVGKKLKQLKYAQIPGNGDNTIYLPFWRIRSDIKGIDLTTYADLIKVANLPKVITDKANERPFRFWIPAFKVRPQVFLRLASHVTLSQPSQNIKSEIPATRMHPSTLPVEEAIESLMITLAEFTKPRRTFMERIADIHVAAKSFSLIFIPFNEHHHEFIQPDFQLAINKNVLALSKSL